MRAAAAGATKEKRPLTAGRILNGCRPYLYLLPILVFAAAFVHYPFFKTFLHSFSVVNYKGEILEFAGMKNFISVLGKSQFQTALANTLKLTLFNVPLTLLVTITMALLSVKRRKLSPVYEVLFTLPMAVSMSAAALIFKVMLNPTVGIVNHVFHLDIGWFTDKSTAIYGILLVTLWMGLGFNYLLFLSAFRAVPSDLLDAARLDGAGYFRRLFFIQLPMVSPTSLYVGCTNMILSMMTAAPVLIITQGGPARSTSTLIYYMYTSGYSSQNYSLAACVSVLAFLLTFAFALLAFVFERKGVNYER